MGLTLHHSGFTAEFTNRSAGRLLYGLGGLGVVLTAVLVLGWLQGESIPIALWFVNLWPWPLALWAYRVGRAVQVLEVSGDSLALTTGWPLRTRVELDWRKTTAKVVRSHEDYTTWLQLEVGSRTWMLPIFEWEPTDQERLLTYLEERRPESVPHPPVPTSLRQLRSETPP